MNQSLYDCGNNYEELKRKSDVIYNAFMNRDTTDLNVLINEIKELTDKKHKGLSNRYKELSERTICDNVRIAKHAFLLFGLFMHPDYAKSLVTPNPRVDPVKFNQFYIQLPLLISKLQNGIFSSLQEFVEDARTLYVII